MRILRPATINDAALTASNVSETLSTWSSGTTYALGAQVRRDSNHRIYESVQAGNLNHSLDDPAWWSNVGPTNRWAMFDQAVGTQTTGATGINVIIEPTGRVDSLALLNVNAATIHVTVRDDGSAVFDQVYSMTSGSGVNNWYSYFYEPIIRKTDLIITDIPLISAPEIEIIAADGGGSCSIGALLVGMSRLLGSTSYGAGVGITDYSIKSADEFGNYTITERAFARKGMFRILIDATSSDEIYRILSSYRATPILYIGSNDFLSTAIYGFFRDFNIEIAYPLHHLCSLEVEGLT